MAEWYESMTKKELRDSWIFFENSAKHHEAAENYYRTEMAKAHEILGRVVHQLSERWDAVNLTQYYPTDNLHGRRTTSNPMGKIEE